MEEAVAEPGATLATAAEAIGRLKVGQILDSEPLESTPCRASLRAAAETVLGSGRSATAVVDEGGNVVGLLTENDVVRAYFEGDPPGDGSVGAWLMGGMARAPRQLLRRLAARPEHTLLEVAERMVANAVAGDTACHHVVVEDEGGAHRSVLSSSDLVQLLCQRGSSLGGGNSSPRPGYTAEDRGVAEVTVREAMKPREAVFTCEPDSTLRHVLKVLLVTRQNSVLIADDDGIHGIFTTRDAIRAFIEAIDSSTLVSQRLSVQPGGTRPPSVTCDDSLSDAAAIMASHSASHVVVMKPGSTAAIGVLSSLDILLCLNRDMALLPAARTPTGPAVAGYAGVSAACSVGATLGEAADLLLSSGRTAAPLLGRNGELAGVITEGDLLKAFVTGCSRGDLLDQWLAGQEVHGTTLPLEQLVVRPATPLLEVAALMCSAAEGGCHMCSHLVVKGDGGKCEGILCALDLMKALCSLRTALDVAQTGADQTTVASVMRSREVVPTCSPGDSLAQAFEHLVSAEENSALVVDEAGVHGLVTPRWALHALAEDVSKESAVASWLGQHPSCAPKEMSPDASLAQVASVMTAESHHHLLAVSQGEPVGVLSSMDVVRGVASMSCFCPFVSLGWLRLCKGPASCTCREA